MFREEETSPREIITDWSDSDRCHARVIIALTFEKDPSDVRDDIVFLGGLRAKALDLITLSA